MALCRISRVVVQRARLHFGVAREKDKRALLPPSHRIENLIQSKKTVIDCRHRHLSTGVGDRWTRFCTVLLLLLLLQRRMRMRGTERGETTEGCSVRAECSNCCCCSPCHDGISMSCIDLAEDQRERRRYSSNTQRLRWCHFSFFSKVYLLQIQSCKLVLLVLLQPGKRTIFFIILKSRFWLGVQQQSV